MTALAHSFLVLAAAQPPVAKGRNARDDQFARAERWSRAQNALREAVRLPATPGDATGLTQQDGGTVLSLDKDIQPIFDTNCTACHAGEDAPLGMDLSAGNAFKNIVDMESVSVAGEKRVKPGDPDKSFLYEKISSDNPQSGSRMPFGGPYLEQADIDKIRQWILQGANP